MHGKTAKNLLLTALAVCLPVGCASNIEEAMETSDGESFDVGTGDGADDWADGETDGSGSSDSSSATSSSDDESTSGDGDSGSVSTGTETMGDESGDGDSDSNGDGDGSSETTPGDGDGDGDGDSTGGSGEDRYPGDLCDPFLDACLDIQGNDYECTLDQELGGMGWETVFKCNLSQYGLYNGEEGDVCTWGHESCQTGLYCVGGQEAWPNGSCGNGTQQCCAQVCSLNGGECGNSECYIGHWQEDLAGYLDGYVGIGFCLP